MDREVDLVAQQRACKFGTDIAEADKSDVDRALPSENSKDMIVTDFGQTYN